MHLMLIGAPASGKGTQAKLLTRHFSIDHISTGDMLREAVSRRTDLGLVIETYLKHGWLVPDHHVVQLVEDRLSLDDITNGFILDGFPRTLEQARALDQALTDEKKDIDTVLYMKVSEEELIRRLSGRWICRDCQTPYHTLNSPPKTQGVCDRCGGLLYQRPDDTEETARNRLKVYMVRTAPLIDYYEGQSKLVEIDGERAIDQVGQSMLAALKAYAGERTTG